MISIKMAGIDYRKASLQYRELFSMTSSALSAALHNIRSQYPVSGCVIIATCNRTELWVSCKEKEFSAVFPEQILCDICRVPYSEYQQLFSCRDGQEAVRYLLELASGLHSQIFGDDQIISQVKQALSFSREQKTTDTTLEVLFRTAITGAKQVKHRVHFTNISRSVAAAAVELLKQQNVPLQTSSCLVIGNGEIGRLTASKLIEEGAETFMTLRRYKAKDVIIPAGCQVIPYERRFEKIKEVSVVISATLSPHYTLTEQETIPYLGQGKKILIDLAIPRDLDPQLGKQEQISLYDMDTFCNSCPPRNKQQMDQAHLILAEYKEEFLRWYDFREWIPIIKETEKIIGKEVEGRMRKQLHAYPLTPEQQNEIQKSIRKASAKTTAKLLYGLRDTLDPDQIKTAMAAIQKSAKKIKP